MNRELKLIWDFKGPDSARTASHHVIHLKEFMILEQLELIDTGVEKIHNNHHIAYLAVHEKDMPLVRDRLQPHRGQLWVPKV